MWVSLRYGTNHTIHLFLSSIALWESFTLACLQVDLFIYNARLENLGSLRAPSSVLPCVGSDPYAASASICSEIQIYGRPDTAYVVLQQRGCTALGR